MLITITSTCLFLLTLYISTTASATTRQYYYHHRNRHLLHQPFFPQETFPPTQPPTTSSPLPQPTPNPKYPFTTATTPPITEKPFFPTIPSPPPPPPPSTAIATFPANISSLLLPHQPSSATHRHVVAIAASISLLCAAVIASVSALFLYSRITRCHSSIPTGATVATAEKTSHSEDSSRLFPPNTAPSDKPPRYTSPNVSSEFLYLGTLVNSRGEIEQQQEKNKKDSNKSSNTTNTTNVASVKFNVLSSATSSTYQKLGSGSPELKPLPPLPRHNYYSYKSGEAEVKIVSAQDGSERGETEEGDDDNEEFFSPRGSSGHKESPKRHGSSSSRRDFQGIIGVDNFGSRSFSSRTALYPCSNSCSPSNSIPSSSQSPVNNVKSPNSAVNFPAPPSMMKRSHSSISSSTSSSISVNNHTSPDRLSVASLQKKQCLEGESGSSKGFVAVKLPPPPPPLPPRRFWEMPVVNSGPPVLVTPSKPVLSPHLANEQLGVERREEETPTKPKLKPLHWDKVRASSDRVMVWDQIKSSSFQ